MIACELGQKIILLCTFFSLDNMLWCGVTFAVKHCSGGDSKCDSAVSNNNHSKDEGSKSTTPSNSALVKQKYHDNGGGGGGWSSMKSAIERLLNSGNSVSRKRRAKIQHLIDDVPAWASLIQKASAVHPF